MALNFPDSPLNGDFFIDPSGRTFVYNLPLTRWEIQIDQDEVQCITSIYIGDIPPNPANTCNGSLWYDCTTNELYIYYQEEGIGQSAQWVPVLNLGNITPSLNLEQLLDVTYPIPPANGDLLAYSGGLWGPVPPGSGFLVQFIDLTDVDFLTTPLVTNDFVKYDGVKWVNTSVSLNDLSNVDTGGLISNQILKYNGINFIPVNHVINELNDVNDTGKVTGDILEFDGTNFVPKKYVLALPQANNDLTAAGLGVQIGGLYRLVGQTSITDVRVRLV